MRWRISVMAALLAFCAACGTDESNDPSPDQGKGDAGEQHVDAASSSTTECDDGVAHKGLILKGLLYSPGGKVLPDPCNPFHPTTNNPYAVRCVDAWPWYKTAYPGDEFCILPPTPGNGVQIGVHPQGKQWFAQVSTGDMSGYKTPTDDFIVLPGEEEVFDYATAADNPKPAKYYRHYARMRGGSHHMINSYGPAAADQEVWGPGSGASLFGESLLPSAQRPDISTPDSLERPTEDAGLYGVFPAKAGVIFDMHHFNVGDVPILKEAWVNLWWEGDATVLMSSLIGLDPAQTSELSVQPGETQDLHYMWNITEPVRLLSLTGHRHAWTTNFSTWVEAPGKDPEIVYQSFGWSDQPEYHYGSQAKNPAPAPDKATDGGSTGLRMLQPGEALHFNCHIEYSAERAAAVDGPDPIVQGPLKFANEAFSGEMCLLFGWTAEGKLPLPTRVDGPVPDFATVD